MIHLVLPVRVSWSGGWHSSRVVTPPSVIIRLTSSNMHNTHCYLYFWDALMWDFA